MKTKRVRRELREIFGDDYRDRLEEATAPYVLTLNWECIAKGRRRDGKACIMELAAERDPTISHAYVLEHYTYLQFHGDDAVYRYLNSDEMREVIHELDATNQTCDLEDGDEYIIEPLARNAARSFTYQNKRRQAIKDGTHVVKPRGPNPNMRRTPVHHFRPH